MKKNFWPFLSMLLLLCVSGIFSGCGASAKERQAEALFVSAREKESTPGSKNLYQAFSIYEGLVREFDGTDAAKRAKDRVKVLTPTVDSMRYLDARAREIEMRSEHQRLLNAARGQW